MTQEMRVQNALDDVADVYARPWQILLATS